MGRRIFNERNELFDLGNWEKEDKSQEGFFESSSSDNQFVLLQLSDGDKRILSTTEIQPKLIGTEEKPDVKMLLDFEGFHVGDDENVDRKTKATLQLKIGQESSSNDLDKLFYCINGGLDLYNNFKNEKSNSKDFRKNTSQALGNKPISLPKGVGRISLQVVKHQDPKWWQKVFKFANSDGAQDLFSLVGFGGITQSAVSYVGEMFDMLFDKDPEILFQSQPVKACFTQSAKEEISGGLSTNYVSSLNPGFWVLARKKDYQDIVNHNPIYFGGFGVLAPDGMSEIDAIRDSENNPFSKLTYAVIRARINEMNLNEGMVL